MLKAPGFNKAYKRLKNRATLGYSCVGVKVSESTCQGHSGCCAERCRFGSGGQEKPSESVPRRKSSDPSKVQVS